MPANAAQTSYVSFTEGDEYAKFDMAAGDRAIITTATYPGYSRIQETLTFKHRLFHSNGKLEVVSYKIVQNEWINWEKFQVNFPEKKSTSFSSIENDCKYQLEITCIEPASFSVEKIRLEDIQK